MTRTFAVLLLLLVMGVPARSEARVSGIEENDSIAANSDRHYTQGIHFAYTTPTLGDKDWQWPFTLPMFEKAGKRKITWSLTQSIFTPRDIHIVNPDPRDRPYAGWLTVGASFLQETKLGEHSHMLENFEVQLGVVGPAALGRQAQNDWHQIIGVPKALGWAYQLSNEPSLNITYERKWRISAAIVDGVRADIIPAVGATVGNALTYGAAGATVRIGHHLDADYGPARIRPAVSGTEWFTCEDACTHGLGWYVFVGVEGRLVARNVFLDGSSFTGSRSVQKKHAVADISGGVSVFWGTRVKLDLSLTRRTKEFAGQTKQDKFAMIGLSFGL